MSYLNDWWRVFFGGMEYPYTDSCKYNDDWLLEVVKKLVEEFANFVNLNKIKYADPILWNITRQYEANTIVIDPQTGDAYISTNPVPYGVHLSNSHYWTKIYNYANVVNTLEEQIAPANEGLSTTATAPRSVNDLVWLNGLLYRVTASMIAGDTYVVNSNCVKTTIEAEIARVVASIGDLTALETTNKNDIVSAVNEVVDSVASLSETVGEHSEDIIELSNYHKSDVKYYGAIGDGVTDDTQAIKAAIAANKYVYFSEGEYLISETLNITKSMVIDGCENAKLVSNVASPMFYSNIIEPVTIKNITMRPYSTAIKMKNPPFDFKTDNVNQFYIHNVTFSLGANTTGIDLEGVWDSFISYCTFTGDPNGQQNMYGQNQNGVIISYNNTDDFNSENVTVESCRFDAIAYPFTVAGNDGTINVGALQLNDSIMLRCGTCVKAKNIEQLNVIRNIMDNCLKGLDVQDIIYSQISNNRIAVLDNDAIDIDRINGDSAAIMIHGNELIDYHKVGAGVNIHGTLAIANVAIQNNMFANLATGFKVDNANANYIAVTNNTYMDCDVCNDVISCASIIVNNNVFGINALYPLKVTSATLLEAENNSLYGYNQDRVYSYLIEAGHWNDTITISGIANTATVNPIPVCNAVPIESYSYSIVDSHTILLTYTLLGHQLDSIAGITVYTHCSL